MILLFDIELDSATKYVATQDFYYSGQKYLGCVLPQSFDIREKHPNLFYGIAPVTNFSFSMMELADAVNTPWIEVFGSDEFRGRWVKVQRYNETDGMKFVGYGRINNVSFGNTINISTDFKDLSIEKLLPAATITTDTFTDTALDLGKPINICFGHCRDVPLYNVNNDLVNDYYDYLIGYGVIDSINESEINNFGVKRNGVLVATSEYTFYDGSQGSPYNGYAFIRFVKEQMDFNNGYYTLTADVKGLELGTGSVSRNFAKCLYNLLTDSTWGLGDSANAASFTAAESTLSTGNGFYCDGAIINQESAQSIIDSMLMSMRSFLYRNSSKEWEITVCAAGSSVATFGFNDGRYNNIVSCGPVVTVPANEIISTITVHYDLGLGRAFVTSNDAEKKHFAEITHVIDADFGVDQVFELKFVREDDTAEKFVSWMTNNMVYSNVTMELQLDLSGRNIALNDIVTLEIPDRNLISSDWLVSSISYNHVDLFNVTVRPYSASIFGDVILTPTTAWSGTATVVSGPKTIINEANIGDGVKHPGQLTLQIADTYGDTYIRAGKTDFEVANSGFILGIDDSDGNKAKLYLGDATEYFTWNGSKLVFTGSNSVIGNLNLGDGVSQVGRLTLQVAPTYGDTYIRAGKTDFTNAETGFILGIDDSDSDRAKFYVGDTTSYFNWTGTSLVIETPGLSIDSGAGSYVFSGDLSIDSIPGFIQNRYCAFSAEFAERYGEVLHDSSKTRASGVIDGADWMTVPGGIIDYALLFVASNTDNVVFAANTAWDVPGSGNKNMAWELWLYVTDATPSTSQVIWCKGAPNVSGWYIVMQSDGKVRLTINKSGGNSQITTDTLHDFGDAHLDLQSTWVHVVFVYNYAVSDAGTVDVYVNGEPDTGALGTTSIDTMASGSAYNMYIGSSAVPDAWLDGYLCLLKLYNGMPDGLFTEENVKAHYKYPQAIRGGQLTARSVVIGSPSGSASGFLGNDSGLFGYDGSGNERFAFALEDTITWDTGTINTGDIVFGEYMSDGSGLFYDSDAGQTYYRGDLALESIPGFIQNRYVFLDAELTEGYGTIVHDTSRLLENGTFVSTPDWTSGILGKALQFNTTSASEYINFGLNSYWDIVATANKDMAWSFWIYCDGNPTYTKNLFQKTDGATGGWLIRLNTNRTIYFSCWSAITSDNTTSTGALPNNGLWNHVVVHYAYGAADTCTVTFYINGKYDSSESNMLTMATNGSSNMLAGAITGTTENYTIQLNGLKLYNGMYTGQFTEDNAKALYKYPQGARGGQLTARSVYVGTPSGSAPGTKIDDTGLWMYGSSGAQLFGFCTAASGTVTWNSQTLSAGYFVLGDYNSSSGILFNGNLDIKVSGSDAIRISGGTIDITSGSLTISSTGSFSMTAGTFSISGGTASMTINNGLTVSAGTCEINTSSGMSLGSSTRLTITAGDGIYFGTVGRLYVSSSTMYFSTQSASQSLSLYGHQEININGVNHLGLWGGYIEINGPVYPSSNNTYALGGDGGGSPYWYWSAIYTNWIYYIDVDVYPWDDEDDLELLRNIKPLTNKDGTLYRDKTGKAMWDHRTFPKGTTNIETVHEILNKKHKLKNAPITKNDVYNVLDTKGEMPTENETKISIDEIRQHLFINLKTRSSFQLSALKALLNKVDLLEAEVAQLKNIA